jgi:hypothetical protein
MTVKRVILILPERRVITAKEAQANLGIPASSIRAWAAQGKLYAVSIDSNRERWYRLRDVLDLWANTRRRARHTRPSRARCIAGQSDIA